jgi:RimJ/RimL family protein N-acetyltransferase
MTTKPKPLEPPRERWFPLRTPRLLLREFRDEDFSDLHAYGQDVEVARYMEWGPNSPKDTRKFLDDRLEDQKTWPRLGVSLAVELVAEARVIGAVRLELGDPANRAGDLGYTFHRPYWRQGFASEAAGALVVAAFETLGLRRLWASCDARNLGSRGVLEKLGLRREGELRQNVWGRDGWRDTLLYGLLADEWFARRSGA